MHQYDSLSSQDTRDAKPVSHSDCVDEGNQVKTGPLAGLPSWITLDLIRHTIRVWQPYYKAVLTTQDAVMMLLNVGRLSRVLITGA